MGRSSGFLSESGFSPSLIALIALLSLAAMMGQATPRSVDHSEGAAGRPSSSPEASEKPPAIRADANNPNLIEVPGIIVSPQSVSFEILYEVGESHSIHSVTAISRNSSASTKQTLHQKKIEKDLLKTSVAASMDAGASFDKVFKYNIGAKVHAQTYSGHELSWEDVSEYDDSLELKYSESEAITRTSDVSVKASGHEGFIHSGISLKNDGRQPVDISDIRASIVLDDPANPANTDTIESTRLYEGQKVYLSQTCQRPKITNNAGQNADPQNNASTAPEGGDPQADNSPRAARPLALHLLYGESYSQNIDFSCENSSRLLDWVHDTRVPRVQIDFKVRINSIEVSPSLEIDNALKRGVSLRVIDQQGQDHQYYVVAPNGKISAVQALQAAGFQVTAGKTADNVAYIARLNGRQSNCPPRELSSIVRGSRQP